MLRNQTSDLPATSGDAQPAPRGATKLWAWLYSPELTLWVLGLLVAAMALGTLIPQRTPAGPPLAAYQQAFGQVLGALVYRSTLSAVYTSWWFIGLFGLLGANLAACVVKRSISLLRRARAGVPPLSPEQVQGRSASGEITIGVPPQAAAERLTKLLRSRGYRVTSVAARQADAALHALRGGARAWGPLLVHLGMLVVLLAAAYGRFPSLAYNEAAQLASGESHRVDLGDKSFSVRLLDAGTERDASGAPAQYWAATQVVRGDRVVKEYTIRMNRPLRYNGANIVLQSLLGGGYVVEVRKGESLAQVPVVLDESGQVAMTETVRRLQDPPWLVWVSEFRESAPGAQASPAGPAAWVRVDESGFVTENRRDVGWVDAQGVEWGGARFRLVAGQQGAQLGIYRDLGVPVAWAGFALVVVGCLLTFFVTRREVLATLTARGERTRIMLGASVRGLGPGAQQVIESLRAELQARPEVSNH